MRILFDMGHPAHVHFFKNAIWELEKRGHEIKITARDKDVTLQLLDAYGFDYIIRPSGWRPLNLFRASKFIKLIGKEFGADVYVGVHNPYVAMAANSLEKRSVLFTDTPGTKMVNRFSLEKASVVCTPESLTNMFKNQVTYQGFKEMAYLHSDVFNPNPTLLEEYKLHQGETYYIVRFVKWNAYHDQYKHGLTRQDKEELVSELANRGKVLVTSEENGHEPKLGIRIKQPEHLHTLLKYSSGYVGEGATMAKEAAVLGVPSIYVSSIRELPPIDEMVAKGILKTIQKLDFQEISSTLDKKTEPCQMFNVNEEIVKMVEGE